MQKFLKLTLPVEKGLELTCEWKGSLCDFVLTNHAETPKTVGDLVLFTADMPFSADTRVYGEGYNMGAQYGGTVSDCHLIGPCCDYAHYKLWKPEGIHQVRNMAIFYPENEDPLLIGFASTFRFSGYIRFNETALQIALNCENIQLLPGEAIKLEQLFMVRGEKNHILSLFADALNANHPRLEFPEIPTGWCSWLVYGPNITAQNIYDNLEAIQKNQLELKYIQIDDGYQPYMGDWLGSSDKFEGGVKRVCEDIKEQGFEPAIWVAPFIAEKNSELFSQHPDWFVKGEDGAPLCSAEVTFGGWRCGPWYMLDTTHPDALEYLKTVFRTMHDEWGVKYYKLDANMWGAFPYGYRYDDRKTCIEAYRLGMQAIVEAAGKDSFILGCNAPMWPSIGVVHGMRITNDNGRGFSRFASLARECFNRNWQHNRLWINDPDTVLLRNANIKIMDPTGKETLISKISEDEFCFNAAYTMASGGMVLSGDDIAKLDSEKVYMLNKLLPPVQTAAIFDDDTFTVGRAAVSDEKTIIYIFNFEDEAKKVEISLDKKVEILDWFEDKNLGEFDGKIVFPDVPPHGAMVLICTAVS